MLQILAANDNPLSYFANEFQQRGSQVDTSDAFMALGILLGIVAFVCLLWRLATWDKMPWSANSSFSLFWNLCKLHGLRLSDRILLWQVAKQQGLRYAAQLFLEPDRILAEDAVRLSPLQLNRLRAISRIIHAMDGLEEQRCEKANKRPDSSTNPDETVPAEQTSQAQNEVVRGDDTERGPASCIHFPKHIKREVPPLPEQYAVPEALGTSEE